MRRRLALVFAALSSSAPNSRRRMLRRTTLATAVAVLAAFAGHSLAPMASSAQTVPGTIETVTTAPTTVVTGLIPASSDGDAATTPPALDSSQAAGPSAPSAPSVPTGVAAPVVGEVGQLLAQASNGTDFNWVMVISSAMVFIGSGGLLYCAVAACA